MRSIARRGRLPQRAARLHGVPRLEGAALVLAAASTTSGFAVRDGAGGAGPAGVRVRLVRVPLAHPRRLLLDRHAGAHLRGDAAVLPERDRLRRQQRPDRLQAHPRLPAARSVDASWTLYVVVGDRRCWCTYLRCRYRGHQQARARADRGARRRAQGALLRLRIRRTTSCSSGRCRRCCAAWRARSTCRRSASSTRARCSRRTRSRWRSGWRSAGAARWSARVLGAWLVNGGKSWLTAALPVGVAVRAGRAVRDRDAVLAARARRPACASCAARRPGGCAAADDRRRRA